MLLFHVSPSLQHKQLQVIVTELLQTHLAAEGFLSRMLERVNFQRHAAFERFPTRLTGEGHVLGVSWRRDTHKIIMRNLHICT